MELVGTRRARGRPGPGRLWAGGLVGASVAVAVAGAAAPATLGHTLDLVLTGTGHGRTTTAGATGPPPAATGWIVAGVALLVVRVAGEAIADLAGGRESAGGTWALRRRLLVHVFDAGLPITEDHPPGELCSRVVGNTVEAGWAVVAAANLLSTAVPAAVGAVALGAIEPWLLVTFVAGVGAASLLLRSFFQRSRRVVASYQEAQAALAARLVDALAGARTIGAAGTVEQEVDRVLVPLTELQVHGRAGWRNLARGGARGALAGPVVQVAVLAVAGLLLSRGRLSPGEVLAAGWYAGAATGIGDVTTQLNQLARARAARRRVDDVLAAPAVRHGPEAWAPAPGPVGALVLRGVTVAGRGGAGPVLDGLDLVVPAGSSVAVVSRSAAAASALAMAAGRLRDPDGGEVVLDGIPLPRLTRAALRQAIGYGFDRPVLLGTTVRDAVAFGATEPTPAAVRSAARAARADGFVERLPEGYDTPLGAAPMSGGEVQRIGLARTFAHAGRLVILDDATSSLDTATELEVGRAITRELSGTTRLVVARRASTAARTDLVAWVDGGRVRALAPHGELWSDPDYRAVFADVTAPVPALTPTRP